MHFFQVAQAFKIIEEESSRLAMTKKLAELLSSADAEESRIIVYLSLGRLRAPYQGTLFNFAEKNLIKVVAEMLDKGEKEVKETLRVVGDLGSVLATGEWVPEKEMTVRQVYQKLVDLEALTGTGSQEGKGNALVEFFRLLSPLSAGYVARMLVRKLRLGFSEMTIVDALSWAVAGDKSLRKVMEHAYNVSADIGLIAKTLKEGGVDAVKSINITVGIPIRPAAAERLPTAAAIVEKIGRCVAQSKLDGFRLQVHIDKTSKNHPKYSFFSRNMLDMSSMFPDLIDSVRDLGVDTLIVEGEALAYDEQTDSYLPFQETVKRRRKHDINEAAVSIPLKLVLFDLLYLNGESWLEKSHKMRRNKLKEIFNGHDKALEIVDEIEIDTAQELEEFFVENIASGLEGLVVKKPSAHYQPGKRNFNWIKLKRQEEGHLDDTIDAVILGYYYGKGKRASFGIGAFLVGLYNAKKDAFETVAKIGTGLTDSGWIELKSMCDRIVVSERPKNVVCSKDLNPDVWVIPDLVVVIRADEITLSPVHSAGKTEKNSGLALRFPRIMGYRMDKSSREATTVKELQELFEQQKC